MLNGQMMNTELTINSIMSHAEKVYSDSEIVSITSNGAIHRYNYSDAFERVRKLANALKSSGVNIGDRVATLAWSDFRHLELYYAISCSGAICHTINPRLFSEQIDFIVNHAEDKLLFISPEFVHLLAPLVDKLPSIQEIIVLCDEDAIPESTIKGIKSYEVYIKSHAVTFDWPDIDENTASSLCYTSGTTGDPKGVLYSHRSTVLHSMASVMPDAMNFSVKDVILPVVPMFHVNAWGIPYSALMAGAKLVFPAAKMADGPVLSKLMNDENVTFSAGVPTVWLALLDYLEKTTTTLPSLERVIVGGAACPNVIMDGFSEHGVDVIHAWGMTESSPVGTINTLKPKMLQLSKEEITDIRSKQGRLIFGVDLRLIDSEGSEQDWDGKSVGEIQIKGHWICSGYYKLDSSIGHSDGWFSTGDVGFMDREGYLQITDRTKDVIKSGGEWISSIDLENTAMAHTEISEAAVIGIYHPKWTERPLMVVVKKEGFELTEAEVLVYLTDKVAKWWLPDNIVFVDSLPHTATGKVSKKDLRDQFSSFQFSD